MRISDWSSDVCSSDLPWRRHGCRAASSYRQRSCDASGDSCEKARKDSRWGAKSLVGAASAASFSAMARRNKSSRLKPLLRGLPGDSWIPAPYFSLIRSEEHTSELQSLMRISYAVFCLKKKNHKKNHNTHSGITKQRYTT